MSTAAKVSFKSAAGELLAGILDLPEGPVKGWGVFSHGFTLGKDSPAASRMCKALANNGVGMLRFDNLGLGDSGGLWSEGSFSLKVADTVQAAEFMRDAGRTISLLVGHSFGGAAVLAAVQHIPETVAVATVGAPSSPKHVTHDFEPVLGKILSEGKAEVKVGGGRTLEIRRHFVEDLENADLTACITGLRKPLMVLHSPTDNTVGIDNARTIFRTARHPRSFVSLERSDHLLTGKGEAARAAKIISVWAEQYLDTASTRMEVL